MIVTAGLVAGSAPASADARCAPEIRSLARGEAWDGAIAELRAELARRGDVDACIAIEVVPAGGGVRVTIALPDGKATERRVAEPADLRAAVLALVLVPLVVAEPAIVLAPPGTAGSVSEGPIPLGARARPRPQLALAATFGAGWSGSEVARAFGLRAMVERGRWSFALAGRLQEYSDDLEQMTVSYTHRTIEISAELGRELLDLGDGFTVWGAIGPSLTNVRLSVDMSPSFEEDLREAFLARATAHLRATVVSVSRLRVFVELGASADVMRNPVRDAAVTTPVPVPAWSSWLAVGAQVAAWP